MSNKKRKVLSLKEKISIIHELELGEDQSVIVKREKISKSAVSRIWTNRKKICEAFASKPTNTKKIKSSKNDTVDEKLLGWFMEQREKGVPISGQILQDKAIKIAENLNLENFKCSSSWISRFRKRHSISFGAISGESKSADIEAIENWCSEIWPSIKEGYAEKDIFNGDETGLFYKCLPNKTLKFKGEKCSGGKLSKERLTVFLCASANGEKRTPLIIGKFKNPRCFKNQNISMFKYFANKKAWMVSEIFKNELINWDSELRIKNRRILLLIDNCAAHPNINERLTNIKLVFLPPNATSIIQPMDQGVIKNFKFYYRKKIISRMLQNSDMNAEHHISVLDALRYIDSAWNEVKTTTIQNCFTHSKLVRMLTEEKIKKSFIDADENIKLENVGDIFDERNCIEKYINIDENVVTGENATITCFENSTMEDSVENEDFHEEKIEIIEALESIRKVKSFYYNEVMAEDLRKNISQIENDLETKYLNRRKIQKKITSYFKK